MANKINGTVRVSGRTFRAGDEEALADAFKAAKTDKDDVQRLADKGVLEGFGTSEPESTDETGSESGGKAPAGKSARAKSRK